MGETRPFPASLSPSHHLSIIYQKVRERFFRVPKTCQFLFVSQVILIREVGCHSSCFTGGETEAPKSQATCAKSLYWKNCARDKANPHLHPVLGLPHCKRREHLGSSQNDFRSLESRAVPAGEGAVAVEGEMHPPLVRELSSWPSLLQLAHQPLTKREGRWTSSRQVSAE